MRPEFVMYGCMAGYVVMLVIAFGVYMRENRLAMEMESAEKERELLRKQQFVNVVKRHIKRGKAV